MRYKQILIILILFSVLGKHTVSQAAEKQISYQGQLLGSNGTAVVDGTYSVDFLLYTDSVDGSIVWAENADIQTLGGLFSYQIGSFNSLTSSLFQQYPILYLELRISGTPILPRSRLGASAYAFSASDISGYDSNAIKSIETDSENRSLTLYDSLGNSYITFQQKAGDSALIIPDASINADELLNEPGLTSSIDISLTTLTNSEMIDLTKVTIDIPDDGYIVLYGKCYLLLSGTTGANSAIVQIDATEGGGTQFPYYTIAGLSGYTNSGTNYFPVCITRTYYKSKGTYTFRLEAKANYPLPAVAQSWDHILSAFYYPTSYRGVEAIVSSPLNFRQAVPISADSLRSTKGFYKVDLRELEILDKKE